MDRQLVVAGVKVGLDYVPESGDPALGPRFRGDECVREDALSARWESVREPVAGSVIEGNCVAARRGGEQPEVNQQSVG